MAGRRREELHQSRAARCRVGATVKHIAAEDGRTADIVSRPSNLPARIRGETAMESFRRAVARFTLLSMIERGAREGGGRLSPLRNSGRSIHARFPQPVRPEATASSRVAISPKPQPPALVDPPCLKCRDVCRQEMRPAMLPVRHSCENARRGTPPGPANRRDERLPPPRLMSLLRTMAPELYCRRFRIAFRTEITHCVRQFR